MNNIAGIDPGLEGGYAILDHNGAIVQAGRLPTITHGKGVLIDAVKLHQLLLTHSVSHTVIENVATRPGQGVSSSGQFMKAVGTLYGAAAIAGSVSWVTPVQWKRYHGLLKQTKDRSREKAILVWPDQGNDYFRPKRTVRTKRHAQDVAEAALIARWYYETKGKSVRDLLRARDASLEKLGLVGT